MDMNQLQLVERLCQKLYQSPSAEERREAENALAEFTSSLAYVPHLRHILDYSSSTYARMFSCFRFLLLSSSFFFFFGLLSSFCLHSSACMILPFGSFGLTFWLVLFPFFPLTSFSFSFFLPALRSLTTLINNQFSVMDMKDRVDLRKILFPPFIRPCGFPPPLFMIRSG